jgi:hypothetical protein
MDYNVGENREVSLYTKYGQTQPDRCTPLVHTKDVGNRVMTTTIH